MPGQKVEQRSFFHGNPLLLAASMPEAPGLPFRIPGFGTGLGCQICITIPVVIIRNSVDRSHMDPGKQNVMIYLPACTCTFCNQELAQQGYLLWSCIIIHSVIRKRGDARWPWHPTLIKLLTLAHLATISRAKRLSFHNFENGHCPGHGRYVQSWRLQF